MRDEFLDGLVGSWSLTGEMGSTPLLQSVEARWVLADSFVELRFEQTDHDASSVDPRYEAIYLIGFDTKRQVYVFHLFDTKFGVSATYGYGMGVLEGDRIEFTFLYMSGRFFNTLERNADRSWTWLLETPDGDLRRTFAKKHMIKA